MFKAQPLIIENELAFAKQEAVLSFAGASFVCDPCHQLASDSLFSKLRQNDERKHHPVSSIGMVAYQLL